MGTNCEVDIDECSFIEGMPVDICKHGGECNNTAGSYMCLCVAGYMGRTCEVDIDECGEEPCLHGGLCIDLINTFTCNCTGTGYEGII